MLNENLIERPVGYVLTPPIYLLNQIDLPNIIKPERLNVQTLSGKCGFYSIVLDSDIQHSTDSGNDLQKYSILFITNRQLHPISFPIIHNPLHQLLQRPILFFTCHRFTPQIPKLPNPLNDFLNRRIVFFIHYNLP